MSTDHTTETLPDGAIRVCVGDRCGTVSSWHLVEGKAAQLRQLGPAQLAADIRTACESTWIHQPVVAALLELASIMERQPVTPVTLRAIVHELKRYP
jgi:hypothetical protein